MSFPVLKEGDCLLYSGKGIFSWLIKIKTWSKYSHVEVYIGHGQSFASRDGEGVEVYWMRGNDLAMVLRPTQAINVENGMDFIKATSGQRYDWWGLLRFFTLGKQSTRKQFCSELATRFYNACGFYPFSKKYDADLVSPGMFASSAKFNVIWEAPDGKLG